MSIRRAGMIFGGGLAAAVSVASASALFLEYKKLTASVNAGNSITAMSLLYNAAIELSFERSIMQVGLALPGPLPEPFVETLNEQRELSNENFEALLEYLEEEEIPNEARFLAELDRVRSSIEAIREEIDPDLSRAAVDRSTRDAQPIMAMKSLIAQLQATAGLIRPPPSYVTNDMNGYDLLMQRAWVIREYGGRERTHFAIATALGAPIDRQAFAEMHQSHGRVMQAWELADSLVRASQFEPGVVAAFERMRSEYFGSYNSLRQELYAAAETGQYQTDFSQFFAASSAALDAVTEVVRAAGSANIAEAEERERQAYSALVVISLLSLAGLILVFFAVRYMVVRVSGRIAALSVTMARTADGDWAQDLSGFVGADEVGEMAKTLETFRDGLREAEEQRRTRELERQEAQAQLLAEKARIADEFESRMGALANEFGKASDELSAAATSLAAAAEETSRQAGSVASAASAASSSVQTAAAGTEELSSSIQEISERVSHSAEMATSVAGDAERSNREVMALATAAQQINEVVSLIADIADKTNLLALNATIEAARAGAAGAGFAVVASEVKELASQTARATEEIRVKIGEVQSASGSAVSSMTKVGAAIEELRATATAIAGAVEQQRAATSEISESTGRAAHSAGDVSDSVGGLSVAAETTGSASSQLLALSQDLSQRSGNLREEVSRFAKHLRSA